MKPPRELRHGEPVKNIVEAWNTLVRYVKSITPRNGGTNVLVRTTSNGTTFEALARPRNRSAATGGAASAPKDFQCSIVRDGNAWKVVVGRGAVFSPGGDSWAMGETELEISSPCYVAVDCDFATSLEPVAALYDGLDNPPDGQLRLWLVHVAQSGNGSDVSFAIDRIFHEGSFWWI